MSDRCDSSSVAASLFLGHAVTGLGAVAAYLHSRYTDQGRLRRDIAERVFGPLDGWPDLPENTVVRNLLPEGPWGPQLEASGADWKSLDGLPS